MPITNPFFMTLMPYCWLPTVLNKVNQPKNLNTKYTTVTLECKFKLRQYSVSIWIIINYIHISISGWNTQNENIRKY